MDMKKIGAFLAQLRKDSDLTQEQLGEQLGVTNKTVSRWENGNYLPPVEMLQSMSTLYGLTINEILSGERLTREDYQQRAEENIKSVLQSSSFTVQEKIDFFKRKWKKEHRFSTLLFSALLMSGYFVAFALSLEDRAFLISLAACAFVILRHNVMMAYVEGNVFNTPDLSVSVEESNRKTRLLFNRLRIAAMLILALAVLVTVDLGYNFFASVIPEMNDGLTVRGNISSLIFGDQFWSREWFFRAFSYAMVGTGVIAVLNLFLACAEKIKK